MSHRDVPVLIEPPDITAIPEISGCLNTTIMSLNLTPLNHSTSISDSDVQLHPEILHHQDFFFRIRKGVLALISKGIFITISWEIDFSCYQILGKTV